MAKVVITIQDDGEDGGIKVMSEFDPPIDNTGSEDDAVEKMTPAQRLGAFVTMQLMDRGSIDLNDEEE